LVRGLKASEVSSRGRPNTYSVKGVGEAAIDKAKPIEDPEFLIFQLELHNRLHLLHMPNKLPNTMMSLYLEIAEPMRAERLSELEAEMEEE
jgi:hypothetical protein